jgi:ABC-type transport system substrate-binding protein
LGLKDINGDGVLEDSRGAGVRFSLLTHRGNTARERAAAVLQEDLRKIGIAVDIVALEFGALIERFTQGDYDAVYFGAQTSDTDPAVNLDFWLSSGAFHPWNPGQQKAATAWERRVDELMQKQVAVPDRQQRQQLFEEVQQIFSDQLPAIYFVAPRLYVVTSSRVGNATPALLRPHVLWNAETLAVAPPAG